MQQLYEQNLGGERLSSSESSDQEKLEGLLSDIQQLQKSLNSVEPSGKMDDIKAELAYAKTDTLASVEEKSSKERIQQEIESLKGKVKTIRERLDNQKILDPEQLEQTIKIASAQAKERLAKENEDHFDNPQTGIAIVDNSMKRLSERIG